MIHILVQSKGLICNLEDGLKSNGRSQWLKQYTQKIGIGRCGNLFFKRLRNPIWTRGEMTAMKPEYLESEDK